MISMYFLIPIAEPLGAAMGIGIRYFHPGFCSYPHTCTSFCGNGKRYHLSSQVRVSRVPGVNVRVSSAFLVMVILRMVLRYSGAFFQRRRSKKRCPSKASSTNRSFSYFLVNSANESPSAMFGCPDRKSVV